MNGSIIGFHFIHTLFYTCLISFLLYFSLLSSPAHLNTPILSILLLLILLLLLLLLSLLDHS